MVPTLRAETPRGCRFILMGPRVYFSNLANSSNFAERLVSPVSTWFIVLASIIIIIIIIIVVVVTPGKF
jgi:ABC-type multidrug transport system permease subunit